MKIDYSTYSMKDLLDVKSRIDADRSPENYDDLLTELERRRRSGHFHGTYYQAENFFDDDEEDDNEESFMFDFSVVGHTKRRYIFIGAMLLVSLIMLMMIVPTYMVKSLDDVRKYNTTLTDFKCYREEIENDETDGVSVFYDLKVTSGNHHFMAYDIGSRMCRVLESDYKMGTEISIWHLDGVVYQLKSLDRMLVSYRYLKPRIRTIQTSDVSVYWIVLIMLWILFFKSFVNAISPKTFTRGY